MHFSTGSQGNKLCVSFFSHVVDDNGQGVDKNKSFALLYAVAQMPAVDTEIQKILNHAQFTDTEKVQRIASLLRNAVQTSVR